MKAKYIIGLWAVAAAFSSCVNDLNTVPIDPKVVTSEVAYSTPESYREGLAKLYGAFSLQGQNGADEGEIDGVDGGLGTFSRVLWSCQEQTTDFAVCAWKNDAYIHAVNFVTWTSGKNEIITAAYYRVTFTVTLINEFLKQTTDAKLAARGADDALRAEVAKYRNEARALRALMYTYGMDLFGSLPFVTEEDPIGKFFPKQASRKELFDYIESELLAVEPLLAEPKAIEFGRLDKGLVWGLLSRLYLNAQVYIGVPKYTESITWAKKVIAAAPYGLASKYRELFMADNNNTNPDVWKEMIFTGQYDSEKGRSWGGTTFLVNASRQGDDPSNAGSGTKDAWGGIRARANLADLFPSTTINADGYLVSPDSRCLLYAGTTALKNARTKDVADPWNFRNGYSVYKWRSDDSKGLVTPGTFSSTDWIFMRLPEIYLTYAEAVLRGGAGGDRATALDLVNRLRLRAYGDASGNISDAELTLGFVLAERGRELYWEGFRRQDLIRYNMFTGADYLWQWKGNANTGRAVDSYYSLFPIPYEDLVANPNLKQNPGF